MLDQHQNHVRPPGYQESCGYIIRKADREEFKGFLNGIFRLINLAFIFIGVHVFIYFYLFIGCLVPKYKLRPSLGLDGSEWHLMTIYQF